MVKCSSCFILFYIIDLGFKKGISFWSLIYLVAYILFPILYKNNISQRFPNKFVFYGILYLILSVVFLFVPDALSRLVALLLKLHDNDMFVWLFFLNVFEFGVSLS